VAASSARTSAVCSPSFGAGRRNSQGVALKMYGDLEFGHKIDPGMY
jgi:hypothetical protein